MSISTAHLPTFSLNPTDLVSYWRNTMATVSQQDVPAVSIELTPEIFKAVNASYDLYTRAGDPGVAILDAISFGSDDTDALATIIGTEAAEEGAGQFIFFNVDA